MKKIIAMMVTGVLAFSIMGCGNETAQTAQEPADEVQQEVTDTEEEHTDVTEPETLEAEEPDTVDSETTEESSEQTAGEEEAIDVGESTSIYTNDYGFTFAYSDGVFTVENNEDRAVFHLKGRENEVYLAVSVTNEYSIDDLAEGLKLQSGTDAAAIEDTTVGSGGYEAKEVFYTLENEQFIFFLVPLNDSETIQIEMHSSLSEDELTTAYMEELISSFTME